MGPLLPYDAKPQSYYGSRVYRADNTLAYINYCKIWYGLELEFEFNGHHTPESLEPQLFHNYAIVKRDGSLFRGAEICTLPAQPEAHLYKVRELYVGLKDVLFVHDTCGMHVHVSRKPLSVQAIACIVGLINNPQNEKMVTAIAGRGRCTYARMYKKLRSDVLNVVKGSKDSCPRIIGTGRWMTDHRDAVNLQNRSTIEFRIFRTPRSFEEFEYRLMFVVACVEWARQMKWITTRWNRFREFVEAQEKYKCLWGWM